MAKRINISVPDELYVKIDHHRNRLKISKICQVALEKAVIAADAKEEYNRIGYSDGLKRSEKITPKDIKKLQEIMNGEDRYSHWSQVEQYMKFMNDSWMIVLKTKDLPTLEILTHLRMNAR